MKTIHKINPIEFFLGKTHPVGKVLFIDFEATEVDFEVAEVTDVYAVVVSYDSEGNLCEILEEYSSLNEPSRPISKTASLVTGLTMAHVKGHKIDWSVLNGFASKVDAVIAYGARYDYHLAKRFCPTLASVPWLCMYRDIPHMELFHTEGKLEWMLFKVADMYFDSHRAKADVEALINLSQVSCQTYQGHHVRLLKLLLDTKSNSFKISNVGAPYELRHEFKSRGFRWDGSSWFTIVKESEINSVLKVIKGDIGFNNPQVRELGTNGHLE